MAAKSRGLIDACVDKLFAWWCDMPPERCGYTVTKLRIPVDESTNLAALLFQPLNTSAPRGTVLVRTPYGLGLPNSLVNARVFAARGYVVLTQACRGTPGSDGLFDPIRHEFADGHATVAWMRAQPWYTGTFGTMGFSYLGHNQYCLLADPPADLKTCVIKTGLLDLGDLVWGTGAPGSDIVAWADIAARLNRGDGMPSLVNAIRTSNERLKPILNSTPMLPAVDTLLGGSSPEWVRKSLTDRSDTHWDGLQKRAALDTADLPIMLTAGWNDILLQSVMYQYAHLSRRGLDVQLTVGPWSHAQAGGPATLADTLAWLEHHLAGADQKPRRAPVRVFVSGAKEWRELPHWPPPTADATYYLSSRKRLEESPAKEAAPASFVFDPANPTPSVAHPMLFDNAPGRAAPETVLGARADVLTFLTAPLSHDVEVCGEARVELPHCTDSPHADLLVLLSEIDTRGRAWSIAERYVRSPQEHGSPVVRLTLSNCAHRFRKGTRIRLLLAGSAHPRYIRNLGSGEDSIHGVKMQKVMHTVQYGPKTKLILPLTTPEGL